MNPVTAVAIAMELALEFMKFAQSMQNARNEGREGLTDAEVATFKAATIAQLALSQTKIDNLGKPSP